MHKSNSSSHMTRYFFWGGVHKTKQKLRESKANKPRIKLQAVHQMIRITRAMMMLSRVQLQGSEFHVGVRSTKLQTAWNHPYHTNMLYNLRYFIENSVYNLQITANTTILLHGPSFFIIIFSPLGLQFAFFYFIMGKS